ncbi:hypothetical protein SARC_09951, partial [Sphaeroforma arctica JP610]
MLAYAADALDVNRLRNRAIQVLIGGGLLIWYFTPEDEHKPKEISYKEFKVTLLKHGDIDHVQVLNKTDVLLYIRKGRLGQDSYLRIHPEDDTGHIRSANHPEYTLSITDAEHFERTLEAEQRNLGLMPYEYLPVTYSNAVVIGAADVLKVLPTVGFLAIIFITYQRARGMGGGKTGPPGGMGGDGGASSIFKMNKSRATLHKPSEVKVKFADVAGCTEAKVEIMEFVNFLKHPEEYEKL